MEADYSSVVPLVPPLVDSTGEILKSMENVADKLEEFGSLSSSGFWEHIWLSASFEQSWCNIPIQKKLVLYKICKFAAYVKRYRSKQVNYIVSFSESRKPFTCSFSIYTGDQLFKDKMRNLPDPQDYAFFLYQFHQLTHAKTKKKTKTSFSSIRFEWDYEMSLHFVVENLWAGSSDTCVQQKTDKSEVTIYFETGTDMDIRVAALALAKANSVKVSIQILL